MATRGVAVERVALHRPTLDDVFLTLTERDERASTDRELELSTP